MKIHFFFGVCVWQPYEMMNPCVITFSFYEYNQKVQNKVLKYK